MLLELSIYGIVAYVYVVEACSRSDGFHVVVDIPYAQSVPTRSYVCCRQQLPIARSFQLRIFSRSFSFAAVAAVRRQRICRCRWCCPHATCMCIALFHVPCFARSNPSVRTKTRPIQYDRVAHSPMYCEYTRTQREIRFSNVSLDHALCVWYLYVAVYAPMCMNNRVRIRWRDSMQIA